MTLLELSRCVAVVPARALVPGDIIQRRYRWTVQTIRYQPAVQGSTPQDLTYRPGRPARVLVRAHHTDRGDEAKTVTIEFLPGQLVKVLRELTL